MHILVVEDDSARIKWFEKEFSEHDLIFEKRPDRARRFIMEKKFDVIFLDHDLGDHVFMGSDEELTGYQVAKVIPASPNAKTPVIVHSWNPIGALNIVSLLKKVTSVKAVPFGMFKKDILAGVVQ